MDTRHSSHCGYTTIVSLAGAKGVSMAGARDCPPWNSSILTYIDGSFSNRANTSSRAAFASRTQHAFIRNVRCILVIGIGRVVKREGKGGSSAVS